jgi:CBS domain-containing protein
MSLREFEREVLSVSLNAPVIEAARRMRDAKIGCVVVSRDRHPIGILTDRDLAVRVVAEGRDPQQTKVSEVVTYDAVTLRRSDTRQTALIRMREHGVRRLPIVDDAGKLVGMVTADDLVTLLAHELLDLGAGIEGNVDSSESR